MNIRVTMVILSTALVIVISHGTSSAGSDSRLEDQTLKISTHKHQENGEKQELLEMTEAELIEKIKNAGSKEEVERLISLVGEERGRDLPVSIILDSSFFPAKTGVGEIAIFSFLRDLYYPESDEGIKQFQEDIGNQATGTLTIGQFEELTRRWTRLRDTEVYAGGDLLITKFDGYVSTEGTWILENNQIAHPINTSEVVCRRETGECVITEAYVTTPPLNSNDDSYFLQLRSNSYDIVSWEADKVIARATGPCKTTTLTVNWNSQEVVEITQTNKNGKCVDETLGLLTSHETLKIARLVPGLMTTLDWWEERKDKTREYINHRYITNMKAAHIK